MLNAGASVLLLAATVAGCGRTDPDEPESEPITAATPSAVSPAEPPTKVASPSPVSKLTLALDQITAPALRTHVEYLASDAMLGRPTPSPQLDDAGEYVARAFLRAGLKPGWGEQGYGQRFECGGAFGRASNIAALIPGTSDEVVMLSAHYDHLGVNEHIIDDSIYNGANDNASGVAAMLTIASALRQVLPPPRRTLLFVAFCGEEKKLRGSQHYAAEPARPLDRTVAMLNLEMLGRPDPGTPRKAWVTGYALSTLSEALDRAGPQESVTFVAGTTIGPVEGGVFHRSDNYPLAQRGVVAHTISTGKLDEYYHSVSDESETLDYEAMVPLARAVARVTWDLANTSQLPQWTAQGRERLGL